MAADTSGPEQPPPPGGQGSTEPAPDAAGYPTGTITAHIRPQGAEEGHAEYRKLAFPVYDVAVQLPENMSSSDAFYFGNPLAIGPHYGMMTNAAIEVIKDE